MRAVKLVKTEKRKFTFMIVEYIENELEFNGDIDWLIDTAKEVKRDFYKNGQVIFFSYLMEKFKEWYTLSDEELIEFGFEGNYTPEHVYYMEESFNEILGNTNPLDLALLIHNGSFNPNDKFFIFNAYGNLESYDYVDDIIEYDEAVEWAIESGKYDDINELVDNQEEIVKLVEYMAKMETEE